jgi:hypothetical protein
MFISGGLGINKVIINFLKYTTGRGMSPQYSK